MAAFWAGNDELRARGRRNDDVGHRLRRRRARIGIEGKPIDRDQLKILAFHVELERLVARRIHHSEELFSPGAIVITGSKAPLSATLRPS